MTESRVIPVSGLDPGRSTESTLSYFYQDLSIQLVDQ